MNAEVAGSAAAGSAAAAGSLAHRSSRARGSSATRTAPRAPAAAAGGGLADRLVPWLLALLAGGLWVAIAVHQWRHLLAPSWDLGIFTQLAQAYSRGEAPIVDIKGVGTHLLGDHWHPLLVLLGPLYRIWPSGLTLLVVQGVLFALSVVPLARVAIARLGRGPGTVVGAAYAVSWGLTSAVWAQFHEIAFAVPLLSLSLAALLRGRTRAAALWAMPLVLVKEDLGLTVAALGLVLLWLARHPGPESADGPPDAVASDTPAPDAPNASGSPAAATDTFKARRIWGTVLLVWGLGWFVLTVLVLLPAFNSADQWDYTGRISGSGEGGGPLANLLTAPDTKLLTLMMLAASAGLVGLLSPIALLALPTLAWRFLGDVPAYWGTDWHYSAVLMPIATAALVDGVARVQARQRRGGWAENRGSGRGGGVESRSVGKGESSVDQGDNEAGSGLRRTVVRWVAALVALAASLVALALGPTARLLEPGAFDESWRAPAARAVHEVIPPGATVASDISLMAHLVPHADVRWTGNAGDPPADWVVIDAWAGGWGDAPPDAAAWARGRWPGTAWETALDRDGFQVARRVG